VPAIVTVTCAVGMAGTFSHLGQSECGIRFPDFSLRVINNISTRNEDEKMIVTETISYRVSGIGKTWEGFNITFSREFDYFPSLDNVLKTTGDFETIDHIKVHCVHTVTCEETTKCALAL